jgi:glutamine synthetase
MSWLDDHTGIVTLCTAISDLNGQPRGKRMTMAQAKKALKGRTKMPLSVLNVDVFGHDIEDSPLVFESGDRDGLMVPTERGPVPMPWLSEPAAMIPMWMSTTDQAPFPGDPRRALDAVLHRYAVRGWQVNAATELEFYLVDDDEPHPLAERLAMGGDVMGLQSLEAYDEFFSDLYAACAKMGIPVETATSESGAGQFEVTLSHGPAMKIADDSWFFKMLVKGLARKHGMAATFMAKPYDDDSGSGMHMHFSVVDSDGTNVFDDGTPAGNDTMRQAVAGCLAALRDTTLIFAPHANSYDRLVPGAHAPTGISWAYENRTAALRIPDGPGAGRRIEHRVAGGDINPYLLFTAVLGAAILGIEDRLEPPPPLAGNAYDQDLSTLPSDWADAVSCFEASPLVARLFPAPLVHNLVMTKRQEIQMLDGVSEKDRFALYFDRV